jgi:hypothetical protein
MKMQYSLLNNLKIITIELTSLRLLPPKKKKKKTIMATFRTDPKMKGSITYKRHAT